jgi:hypothetical protein
MLPSLVNTYLVAPPPATTSAQTAGMVPLASKKLYLGVALAEIDAVTNTYTPAPSPQLPGGICFDGADIWTGEQSLAGPPFEMEFTQWNAGTLLPVTTIGLASTSGNGRTSGDCVPWGGKIWQLANTNGTGPVAQLIAQDLTTFPRNPAVAPPGFNAYDVSRMIVAGGHLYYFQMIGTVLGGQIISLVVDATTYIPTALPSVLSTNLPAVDGIAFDGTDIWATLPSQNMIARVSIGGAVLATYTVNVPSSPTAIAVDFQGTVWVGNSNPGAAAIPINVVLFDLTGTMLFSFPYGVSSVGIKNIVSDAFSKSIWVSYRGAQNDVDQYQYPAAGAGGRFHGTFVGFVTAGQFGGGTH